MKGSIKRDTTAWLGLLTFGLFGCGPARPAPFTQAETEQALAPAADLRQRCYAGTELERRGVRATLDYDLHVSSDGSVRAVPLFVEPDEPRLVECVRHRLDSLRFPARAAALARPASMATARRYKPAIAWPSRSVFVRSIGNAR
jgi:hypothetical protein